MPGDTSEEPDNILESSAAAEGDREFSEDAPALTRKDSVC